MKYFLQNSLILLLIIFVVLITGCSEQYTVQFVNDGELIETIKVLSGEKINAPNEPVKEGYTFEGWYLQDEKWVFAGYEVTEDMTLVAKYTINQYTITFDTDGGNVINPITLDYNSLVNIPDDPVKEGYIFSGWDVKIPDTMPSYNMNIKANWTEATTIKIGALGPLRGEASIYGKSVKAGLELAIEEINEAGGVDVGGVKMTLALLDFINDEANADRASAGLRSLIASDVDIVLGATTSGATEGLIGEAIKYGVPVITPTGTADKLTAGADGKQRDERSNIFRACFYDSYQGEVMAEYAKEKGFTKVYVLFNSSDSYSVGLKDAFVAKAKELGMTVDFNSYTREISDFNSNWQTILSGNYDCVYVPDYYEKAYNIVKTGRGLNFDKPIYGGDGWDGILTTAKNDKDTNLSFLENCFYSNHYFGGSNKETVQAFVEKYKAKYNGEEPNAFIALAYDAVYIAKQAIEQAGSTEYELVVKALTEGTFAGLVTSDSFTFKDGNPQKEAFIITYEDGKEVEAE